MTHSGADVSVGEYDKLVRDDIPDIIADDGQVPVTHRAGPVEFRQRLAEKLVEEAEEYAASGDVEELVDVIEVLHTISRVLDTSRARLEAKRVHKASERGTFAGRVVLEAIEESGS